MTVLEVIQRSSEFLARKGVDSPRLQTELLLAHVLQLPRMKLYLNFERQLTDAELDQLRALVVRRGEREPLQHITGATSFCGMEIAVNRHVLVPRPETELLAELGWTFLATRDSQSATALDFGTGSGCLAIALAMNCPGATLHALDFSAEALAVARRNAVTHKVENRIQFHLGDGFAALNNVGQASSLSPFETRSATGGTTALRFDLIISNPPYIPSGEIATLQPEVRDHDPRSALDGGADGLDFHRRLAAEAAGFLRPGGRLMLEFGDDQAGDVRRLFEEQKWVVEAVTEDYSHRARILTARR